MVHFDTPPAERPAPHQERILAAILADETPASSPRRPWWVPAAVAAAVVALVAVATVTVTHRREPFHAYPGIAYSADSVPSIVRSMTPAEARTAATGCLTSPTFGRLVDYQVAYAVEFADTPAPRPAVILALPERGLMLCTRDSFGWSEQHLPRVLPSTSDAPTLAANPLDVFDLRGLGGLGSRLRDSNPTGPSDGNFVLVTWYACGSDIRTVRQRVVVAGDPGPWYSTSPSNGYAVLATSYNNELGRVPVVLETQVVSVSGEPVSVPGVTDTRTVDEHPHFILDPLTVTP